MTEPSFHHLEIKEGEQTVAAADVTIPPETGTAQASLRAVPGHVPPGDRARLVDAVMDLPDVQDSERLQAALPLGDSETLSRLCERSENATTRAAGASALLDADIPGPGPDQAELPPDQAELPTAGSVSSPSCPQLGRPVQALIAVRIRPPSRTNIERFRDWVSGLPETLGVFVVSGHEDFLIHVAVGGNQDLYTFVIDRLTQRPEVADVGTSVVYEHIRNQQISPPEPSHEPAPGTGRPPAGDRRRPQ